MQSQEIEINFKHLKEKYKTIEDLKKIASQFKKLNNTEGNNEIYT
jgi:membrane protein insertase Oxa1/YidC/SpoIIIJ